jgi:hypothetical protein
MCDCGWPDPRVSSLPLYRLRANEIEDRVFSSFDYEPHSPSMTNSTHETATRIAALNDLLRKGEFGGTGLLHRGAFGSGARPS